MEMKQSKIAQYLAGTLDMEDKKNKNSLYIELAEKLSYGNKDDIAAALAVTEKVKELTGKEPEYEPYVKGMPKRCLGQDIREGYITPSEDAEKMHMSLTGQELPGVGSPSEQEIACTDASIGAKAAGFQTGHQLSGPEKMFIEEQSTQKTTPSPMAEKDQIEDMTFGPSRVIKGALTNDMKEVLEGLKETNSIGASKDLENSLNILSNPGGIAKQLSEFIKDGKEALSGPSMAISAANLYDIARKQDPTYEKGPSTEPTAERVSSLPSQILRELGNLVGSPGKTLSAVTDFYEKAIDSTIKDTSDRIISGALTKPESDLNKGKNVNLASDPGLVIKNLIESFGKEGTIKDTQEQTIGSLGATTPTTPADPQDSKKQKSWMDTMSENLIPGAAAKRVLESFMPDGKTDIKASDIMGTREKDTPNPNFLKDLLSPGLPISRIFMGMKEMANKQANLQIDQNMNKQGSTALTPGGVVSKLVNEISGMKLEEMGLIGKDKGEWMDTFGGGPNNKGLVETIFKLKMEQAQSAGLLMNESMNQSMKKTLPNDLAQAVIGEMKDNPEINSALQGDFTKQWGQVNQMIDKGASYKDINGQISLMATSIPLTVAKEAKSTIDSKLAEGLEQGKFQTNEGIEESKTIFSKFLDELVGQKVGELNNEKNANSWLEQGDNSEKSMVKTIFALKMGQAHNAGLLLNEKLKEGVLSKLEGEEGMGIISQLNEDEKLKSALSGDFNKQWESVEKLIDSGASNKMINGQIALMSANIPVTVAERFKSTIDDVLANTMSMDSSDKENTSKDGTSGFDLEGAIPNDEKEKPSQEEEGPEGPQSKTGGIGASLAALSGSIARGITYSVARKRGLNPVESGQMAEIAGKEAEDVTHKAASSKENVSAAINDVKNLKSTAAKGLQAATELIPNPAIGKAIAVGIAMADKATDYIMSLANNDGSAANKLMEAAGKANEPTQTQSKGDQESIVAAGIAGAEDQTKSSNEIVTMDAFRKSLQKDKKGLTKKLIPNEDFITKGAQTAINSIGSWGSAEVKKANTTPKVDEMHKMVDTPA
jgi:hypothetical protein